MNGKLTSKNGLSLDRLKSFCLVAESGSITRAAQEDTNRQSLFSRQIRELEAYFGAELFKRKGRTISLTENGERLFRLTKEFYASLEDFAECCSLEQRDIRIGAGDSLIQWLLLPRLSDLRMATDGANLILKNMRTQGIVSALLQGDLHYGIIRKGNIHPDLSAVDIGSMGFRLFAPVDLEINTKDEAQAFDTVELAGMEGQGRYSKCLSELGAKHGVILRFGVACSSFPIMAKAMRSLRIAAVLPEIASEELKPAEFANHPLKSLSFMDDDYMLCWNRKLAGLNENLSSDAVGIAKCVTL